MPRHPHIEAFEARQAEARRRARRRRVARGCLAVALAAALAGGCWLAVARPFQAAAPQSASIPDAGSAGAPAPPASAPTPAQSAASLPPALQPPPPSPYDEADLPLLLNADHPIPEDYAPILTTFTAGGVPVTLQLRAADAYQAMQAAAEADGVALVPLSSYRTGDHQSSNFNASVQAYLAQGYTREEAEALTRRYYALPGTSEHEAGLAIDLGDAASPEANLDEAFENTAAYAWLQRHAWEYGFIQRYHLAAESVTGVTDEPWHYRYVGANHAWQIENQRLTLEDYVRLETE